MNDRAVIVLDTFLNDLGLSGAVNINDKNLRPMCILFRHCHIVQATNNFCFYVNHTIVTVFPE